jgi:hypothetical protein
MGNQIFTPAREANAYRAFRVAEEPGPRLARARDYLRAYPNGAWSKEVNEVYVDEEAAYFTKAQQSYQDAINYLTDLPDGPHAAEALASTTVYGQEVSDIETIELLSNARKLDTLLERQSAQRRQVGEHIAAAIGALTSDGVFGRALEDAPAALRRFMSGARTSWGRAPERHVERIRFLIPVSRKPPLERLATVMVTVALNARGIEEGRIEGKDLFIRWAEADYARSFDPESPGARKVALGHAREVLGGALEARLPAAQCALQEQPVVARRCGGWQAVAIMGGGEGFLDVVSIRGPQ